LQRLKGESFGGDGDVGIHRISGADVAAINEYTFGFIRDAGIGMITVPLVSNMPSVTISSRLFC